MSVRQWEGRDNVFCRDLDGRRASDVGCEEYGVRFDFGVQEGNDKEILKIMILDGSGNGLRGDPRRRQVEEGPEPESLEFHKFAIRRESLPCNDKDMSRDFGGREDATSFEWGFEELS